MSSLSAQEQLIWVPFPITLKWVESENLNSYKSGLLYYRRTLILDSSKPVMSSRITPQLLEVTIVLMVFQMTQNSKVMSIESFTQLESPARLVTLAMELILNQTTFVLDKPLGIISWIMIQLSKFCPITSTIMSNFLTSITHFS
jgi:hypothetical protein